MEEETKEAVAVRIHEAAALVGITPRAVRFYEEKGLIAPAKISHNGYRDYAEDDIERLRAIVSVRELGVPVDAALGVLNALHEPAALQTALDGVRAALYEELAELRRKVDAFDAMAAWQPEDDPAERLHRLAGELRGMRTLRSSWRDRWRFDGMAETFDTAPLPQLPAGLVPPDLYHAALEAATAWIDPRAGESGLDLGAGTGNLSARLAERGAEVTAVEQSAAMLRVLRAKLPRLAAKQGNLLSLPIAAGERYAFVASTFALQHLDERQQEAAFAEMDRVLAPGGRICLTGIDSFVPEPDGACITGRDNPAAAPSHGMTAAEPSPGSAVSAAARELPTGRTADSRVTGGFNSRADLQEQAWYAMNTTRMREWFGSRGYVAAMQRIGGAVLLFYAIRGV